MLHSTLLLIYDGLVSHPGGVSGDKRRPYEPLGSRKGFAFVSEDANIDIYADIGTGINVFVDVDKSCISDWRSN